MDIALGRSEGKRAEVAKRWNGGLSIGASRIDLSREQWEWLSKREKIRIAVNSGIPPSVPMTSPVPCTAWSPICCRSCELPSWGGARGGASEDAGADDPVAG